jgi:Protein of unknown function (DUF3540)
MSNPVERLPRAAAPPSGGGYIRSAVVIETAHENEFLVRLHLAGRIYAVPARPALAGPFSIGPGTKVLVAGEDLETAYIIGILENPAAQDTGRRPATCAGGACALAVSRQGRECLQIHDADGRLVFEYDPMAGKSSLAAPRGDLELLAPEGQIRLQAGRGVHIGSEDRLELSAGRALDLAAAGDAGPGSRLRLDRSGAALSAGRLDIRAAAAGLSIDTTTFRGRKLTAAWEHAKLVLGKLETVAIRILERSQNSYRMVEDLHEVKAGRMRNLVRNAFHLQSRNASVLAREEVRIDGHRIDLG